MALVLVVGAGLFLNSFIRLTNQPLGFEPRGRLTMRISLSGQRYADPQGIARFASRLVERARAVAGVADARDRNDRAARRRVRRALHRCPSAAARGR